MKSQSLDIPKWSTKKVYVQRRYAMSLQCDNTDAIPKEMRPHRMAISFKSAEELQGSREGVVSDMAPTRKPFQMEYTFSHDNSS